MYGRVQYVEYSMRKCVRTPTKKRAGFIIGVLILMSGIAALSLAVVLRVLAAPENPEAEANFAAMENMEANEESVSVNEIPSEELTEEDGIPVVVIDAGHGGEDEGCSTEGILEKTINLEIARLVESKLVTAGLHVIMVREDDTYIAKENRVELANHSGADAYISIHQNTFEQSEISGIETWFLGTDTRDSKRLAKLIHQATLRSTGAQPRELRDDADFCVTGQTAMPACLIETGFLSNPSERILLNSPEYRDQIASGIAEGITLYFQPKTMYLTFDDGPDTEHTNAVLDILREKNIKATFFVIGENVRKNPETARRIVAEGHTIGIHCNNHDYQQLYQSVDSYVKDFEEAQRIVREVTGEEIKLFRFPGGSTNSHNEKVSGDIIKAMQEKGYIYFDWNASLEDAVTDAKPEELVRNARESTLGRRRVVLLAHDVKENTVLCLNDLIEEFPDYQMEAITPETEAIVFRR